MQRYEYKVVPAPQKGAKAKGVKTAEGRFAASIEQVLNQMAQDGWEYQRAELLPSEERAGLTSSTVNWRNVLVFRRELDVTHTSARSAPEAAAMAQPITGPGTVAAPAPIAQEAMDPPLSLKGTEVESEADDEAPANKT
ncbi:DUF4177 domain-containing protein [Ruegeria meonggei]|uniref:DUF4177 domain-containing protein n=1 Tax=Ruegeria meonggei TaxID=1446476 RepID=UPI00366F695A